ncbi:hypothetical protein SmJEL517_g02200 [Synchytrium microbalum]|uniref:Uncharacterized protein n=1 Tax=Synchytrium microbalum TaxID=1806994 RepID=A0A507CBH5_9FUNG|nr:uncharacterized protein SmJEL517_g02200 [Synchytrium microbalum]TPX35356.1 hypothetical protein SmJEL517_g02200 [Synchytrium microbalum]
MKEMLWGMRPTYPLSISNRTNDILLISALGITHLSYDAMGPERNTNIETNCEAEKENPAYCSPALSQLSSLAKLLDETAVTEDLVMVAVSEVINSPQKQPLRRPFKEGNSALHHIKDAANTKLCRKATTPLAKLEKLKSPFSSHHENHSIKETTTESPFVEATFVALLQLATGTVRVDNLSDNKQEHQAAQPFLNTPVKVISTTPKVPGSKSKSVKPITTETVETWEPDCPSPVLFPDAQTPNAAAAPNDHWQDLDADDAGDTIMVSEYVVEIFEHMRRIELRTLAMPNYIDYHEELCWTRRNTLIDWIVDVHWAFRLLPETLYLTVNIIDRFLSARIVSLAKLQLVGITSLMIACKYEETISPSIHNLLYMVDNGYTQVEIIQAERYILSALEFSVNYQSPMSFLRRGSKADSYDPASRMLAKYLMEITIVDERFLICPPSEIAAAGLYLARRMLQRGEWDATLIHYSGYTEQQLGNCVNLMVDSLSVPTPLDAVYRKYTSKKLMRASSFARHWMGETFEGVVASPTSEADLTQ